MWAVTAPLRPAHFARHLHEQQGIDGLAEVAGSHSGLSTPLQRAVGKALQHEKDRRRREELIKLMRSCSLRDPRAMEPLVLAMESQDAGIRHAAVEALAGAVELSPRAVDALFAAMDRDGNPSVRGAAAATLSELAPKDPRLERALLGAIERGEPYGAIVLFNLNADDPRVPAAFARYLRSPDPTLRRAWLDGLADDSRLGAFFRSHGIRPELRQALAASPADVLDLRPTLLGMLRDSDGEVRSAAISALGRAYPKDADVEAAISLLLADPIVGVRQKAAQTLSDGVCRDLEVQRRVVAALEDEDERVRRWCGDLLERLEPEDRGIQLGILRALNRGASRRDGTNVSLKAALMTSFRKDSNLDAPRMDALLSLLSHEDLRVRDVGVEILRTLDSIPASAQVALARQLEAEGDGFELSDLCEKVARLLAGKVLCEEARAEMLRAARTDSPCGKQAARLIQKQGAR